MEGGGSAGGFARLRQMLHELQFSRNLIRFVQAEKCTSSPAETRAASPPLLNDSCAVKASPPLILSEVGGFGSPDLSRCWKSSKWKATRSGVNAISTNTARREPVEGL